MTTQRNATPPERVTICSFYTAPHFKVLIYTVKTKETSETAPPVFTYCISTPL